MSYIGKPFDYDLFVSYAHTDSAVVEALQQSLRGTAIRLFVDRDRLYAGIDWLREISRAVEASDRVLAVYSPEYLGSKYCLDEFGIAHFAGMRDARRVTGHLWRRPETPECGGDLLVSGFCPLLVLHTAHRH